MNPIAHHSSGRFAAALAGLQAGTIGTLAMLLWMGVSAVWQRRTFWTSANLLATIFYGGRAVHNGFSSSTFSGLALYLLLYSTLGLVFGAVAGARGPSPRLMLAGIVTGLGWYYLSFHFLWSAAGPLIPLLHAVAPTVFGHIIYGVGIGRFPHFLPPPATSDPDPAIAPAVVSSEIRE
jgi:hypothetical protein